MSAFIAMAYEDRVELLTDGAICDEETGALVDVRRKVWHSDTVPIAVTGRGNSEAVETVCVAIVTAAEMLGGFDPAMSWLIDALAERQGIGGNNALEIVVTGIAESRGPVVLYFNTAEGQVFDGAPVVPWVLTDMAGAAAAPVPSEIDTALVEGLAFVVGGSMAMDAMRKTLTNDAFRPLLHERYTVGGCIDHTVISAEGVEVTRIHIWPDVTGEPIYPFSRGSLGADEPKYASGA
ncbi:hypothetical protein [Agrobacterium tumefaciens]|uniref:hypothetical protein n=1 Tax=Agrobacterium tumefaciens TaxID=358 RepID=UPI00080FB833|nr:hypothetical protein [Agrobacterium tumefaciens]NSL22886.1 hypothetical protein [Agrobacterium tumefaciens]NTC56727.1 hypothetical protein [Agrobacterium tumefaciens]NTC62619.1 hypothetical protein [Agrobacterium tumefaciens]NTC66349.1 hypothetical protein [Agrobacterium tumefaciens]NTC74930.1 hypothetical protein [Agrobacterium tumefaciens]